MPFVHASTHVGIESETTSAAKTLEDWTWYPWKKIFWFLTFFGSLAPCVNQKQTAPNKLSRFYLKAWALLPRAASLVVCLEFVVSFGLKRAPEERLQIGHNKLKHFWFHFLFAWASYSLLAWMSRLLLPEQTSSMASGIADVVSQKGNLSVAAEIQRSYEK